MRTYKSIEYAYPGSRTAKYFGMEKTGCYFVKQTYVGAGSGVHPQANSEAFSEPDDADLISLFIECDADAISPAFLRFGEERVLQAIRSRGRYLNTVYATPYRFTVSI